MRWVATFAVIAAVLWLGIWWKGRSPVAPIQAVVSESPAAASSTSTTTSSASAAPTSTVGVQPQTQPPSGAEKLVPDHAAPPLSSPSSEHSPASSEPSDAHIAKPLPVDGKGAPPASSEQGGHLSQQQRLDQAVAGGTEAKAHESSNGYYNDYDEDDS